jgi:DNA-binding XRE family transcriptional regulator
MDKRIEKLKALIAESAPNCVIDLDTPDEAAGNWWIDVHSGKKQVTLDYRPGKGFGVYHSDAGYGEGPAEVYRTPELAARRVMQLIKAAKGKHARLTLKDLRELYECSQVTLAEKVGVKQSAISRLEQRSEVKLGTLASAIEALGGELEVRARFSDANVAISVKD